MYNKVHGNHYNHYSQFDLAQKKKKMLGGRDYRVIVYE